MKDPLRQGASHEGLRWVPAVMAGRSRTWPSPAKYKSTFHELLGRYNADGGPYCPYFAQDATHDVALSRLPRAHRGLAAGAVAFLFFPGASSA